MQPSTHADISQPPADDHISTKIAKTVLVFPVALGLMLLLSFFAMRFSVMLWVLFSSLLLPIAIWFRLDFKKWCIRSLVIALVLTISPIDIVVANKGKPGLHFMPEIHGLVYKCPPGKLCTGCFVTPYDALAAVVISF